MDLDKSTFPVQSYMIIPVVEAADKENGESNETLLIRYY